MDGKEVESKGSAEKDEKLDAGYRELAADPEYREEQRRRKVMRGVFRRRSAIKMRWPDS